MYTLFLAFCVPFFGDQALMHSRISPFFWLFISLHCYFVTHRTEAVQRFEQNAVSHKCINFRVATVKMKWQT